MVNHVTQFKTDVKYSVCVNDLAVFSSHTSVNYKGR
jgi:hypothetical protein